MTDHRYNFFHLRGHMRSGTNWLGRLLNLHPRVWCTGEFDFEMIRRAVARSIENDWTLTHFEPTRSVLLDSFHDMVRRCIVSRAGEKPGGGEITFLGDRSPQHLVPMLPEAPLIWIVRDGRDVAVSWTYHQLRIGGPPDEPLRSNLARHRELFNQNPAYFIEHPDQLLTDERWVRHVARSWGDRARHDLAMLDRIGRGEVDARVHTVRYEQLLEEPTAQRDAVLRFLGLDPALAEPVSAQTQTAAGFDRERPDRFNRKGSAGDWKRYASDDFARWFNDEAGDMLVELGYETGRAWSHG